METFSQFLFPGLVFLLTLAFGFWLSQRGKPYHGLLFNIHKLIALAAVILAGRQVYLLVADSSATLIVALGLAAVCSLVLFVSGALLSAGKLEYRRMLTIHRIASPALLAAALWAIQLLGRQA